MMINDDVFLNFGWWSWFWWHFLFLHCKIVSILVIYDRMLFSQYYELCDSTLVQSRKECSCRWRKRWNIRLVWFSIGFLCFSLKHISLLFTNIFLRFFKPYFSDPPGQLLVLDEGMLGIKLYMLSGLHWLFATNLSWKWLQVAELSWKGVNWVHLKNCRHFFF